MFKNLLKKVVGDPNKKLLDSLRPIVDAISEEEPALSQMSDDQLREFTAELQARAQGGEDLDDMLIEAFALVREASKRTIGLRHYDVQMMGGILLHRGEIVEMRTGEGKTLVGTCPLFLNALSGKGVHLVTVNDYLARRDGGWMGNIFNFLGLTVGCIGPQRFSAIFDPDFVNPGAELEDDRLVHWRPSTRQESYKADITYGTSSEFGFDYLRDNLAKTQQELSQRPLNFAVIDEVDNVLIDEARTPLIISGPANKSGSEYKYFATYVRGLKKNTAEDDEPPNGHYDIDEKSRSISLTETGIAEIEKRIEEIDHEAGESLWDPKYFHLTYYLDNALKAQYMFNRDKEYVVQEGKIVIVDDFTGRLMPGRRYSDGLHEAIEAKENVVIQRENITVATVTIQNYFRIYEKLSGMTGTAMTDAEEFSEIYEVDVTPLPTNVQYIFDTGSMGLTEKKRKLENSEEIYYVQPGAEEDPIFYRRTDFPDQVYGTEVAKDDAILAEVERMVDIGRPVLVGTTSVEHSEMIHKSLKSRKIGHQVLNAKQHQSEALIVAQAGRQKSVTISTNMAGRGTDILLGGNPEGMSAEALEQTLFDRNALNGLALKLVQDGEQAARKQANSHSKLDESLVDALIESKASFDGSLKEIEQLQLGGFVARRLAEQFGCDFNEASQIVRLAQARTLSRAREHALSLNLDTSIVEEANSQLELFGGYERASKDSKKSADFLAHLLFEKHYNGRAALVSLVLDGEVEEARVICDTVPAMPESLITLIQDIVADTKQERDIVMKLGGLHVIGSERHESRRIDNQLRGRAARQGDPGSSRFFLSLEDDLMVRFGGNRLQSFMTRTNIPDDMPIEAGMLDRIIQSSQERLEGFNFDGRKNVVEYDDVMNKQRITIYGQRRAILMGESDDVDDQVEGSFETNVRRLVDNYLHNYPDYMRGELTQVADTMTTEATDTINVRGVIKSLRSLLPGLTDVDPDTLESERPDKLVDQLMYHVHVNEDDGTNLLQLINAMGAFLPLLPPVPNLGLELGGRRSDHLSAREAIRLRFLTHVKNLYNEFIGAQVEPTEREQIWGKTADNINQAFNQFSVSGMNVEGMKQQQPAFKRNVDEALRDMLVGSMEALDGEQLVSATLTHVNNQQDIWRGKIGDEEFANFQRLLMLSGIDREWRDYLTAMDDLRREIGLESVAQRDPKVEYKRRSYEMFTDMRSNIDDAIVQNYFRQLQRHQQFMDQQKEEERRMNKIIQGGYTVNGGGSRGRVQRTSDSVGRNDPCPCGSGQKYKNCHLKSDRQGQAAPRQAAAPTRPANSGSTPMRAKNKHKKKKKRRK